MSNSKKLCSGFGELKGKCKNEYHTHAPCYCLSCYGYFINECQLKESREEREGIEKLLGDAVRIISFLAKTLSNLRYGKNTIGNFLSKPEVQKYLPEGEV